MVNFGNGLRIAREWIVGETWVPGVTADQLSPELVTSNAFIDAFNCSSAHWPQIITGESHRGCDSQLFREGRKYFLSWTCVSLRDVLYIPKMEWGFGNS